MSLAVLNVGAGDTKLVFDPEKPEERRKAAAAVRSMLRAGFSIFAEKMDAYGKTAFIRVHDFDDEACEYIIMEAPDGRGEEAPAGRRRGRTRRIPAGSTRAVAVGRTSGG